MTVVCPGEEEWDLLPEVILLLNLGVTASALGWIQTPIFNKTIKTVKLIVEKRQKTCLTWP